MGSFIKVKHKNGVLNGPTYNEITFYGTLVSSYKLLWVGDTPYAYIECRRFLKANASLHW